MASLANMKIGTRLGLGFAILLGLQLTVAGIGLGRMSGLADQVSTITEVTHAKTDTVNQIQDAIGLREIATRNLALVTDPRAQKADIDRVKSAQVALDKALERLAGFMKNPDASTPDERQMFADLAALEATYRPILVRIVGLATAQRTEEAGKALTTECMPILTQVLAKLADFDASMNKQAALGVATTQASYEHAKWLILAISGASLVLGGLLAWRLTRSITGPLVAALDVAQRVAAGDLTMRIGHKGNDEAGQLLAALRQMTDSLTEVVGNVRRASDSIATGAAEISSGNQDLSQRTESQASALEETAASMEQLGATVRQNADNARQANQLALGASTVATRGGEVVGQVVETMQGINDSSKKIADIISVIDGIAFQTNILALNAAVEAARAGEQGRGFAVVASEVRSLAQRSAEAAKEIKGLISASVERVEKGTELVDQAGTTMSEIVGAIRRVTDIVGEISSASAEQSAGVAQIGEAVTQMDKSTQQNAALVEESAAAAESLRDHARRMVETVAVFKLAPGGASGSASASTAGLAPKRFIAPGGARIGSVPSAGRRPEIASRPPASSAAPAFASVAKPAAAPDAATAPRIERRGANRATNVIRPTFETGARAAPAQPTGTDDWESF